MKNGMVIIDADGHAVDNEAVYRERLPEQYRKRNFIVSSDGFDRGQKSFHLAAHSDPFHQWPVCWPRAIRG